MQFPLANIALSSHALSVSPEPSIDEDERDDIAEGLICVLCGALIFVSPGDLGRRAVLWRLASCGHPVHLQCLSLAAQLSTQATDVHCYQAEIHHR